MKKLKMFCLGLMLFIISPIYVPVLIMWQERNQIAGFYVQCYKAITLKNIGL
jgi:hypothetical protein